MKQYYHSVKLDKEECKGCTNCIKRCPTEAIRVRDGKARIIEELCIDCGECIRTCPNHAKIALEDSMSRLNDFKYNIALPAPSFYGQFDSKYSMEEILSSLLEIGFEDVFEVALAAEAVTMAINNYLKENTNKRPLISQACPAVLGLIQVKFPLLIDHVVRIDSPMNIAAKMAKEKASNITGYKTEDIGAFFITPCPAKITSVRQPPLDHQVYVDGAFSIASIYGKLLKGLKNVSLSKSLQKSSGIGIGWGKAGGEIKGLKGYELLAVDGIHNVISVFEQIEKGELSNIDYLECQACTGGCVGGCLTVKNPYIAKVRLNQFVEQKAEQEQKQFLEEALKLYEKGYFSLKGELKARKTRPLDRDISVAIKKMEQLEATLEDLPGLDCSSCGCPNCRALAEDIVRGYALETDCVFKLRKRVEILAAEVFELAKKVPPAMGNRDE